MSQNIPKTKYPSSDTWDKMDKTDPYSMIMKVAALQAAAKVVLETPDLFTPKQPKLKRNDNCPGPLSRARVEDDSNLVPSEVVNQPTDEEDSDSVLSAREKAEQDRLFERIVVSSYAIEEDKQHDSLWRSIKNCSEADSSWGLYEYKAVFRAPIHFAEFYKKSMDDVVSTQCKIDGGEVKSITFSDVKNR